MMKIKKIFKKALLPNGYPHSVSDDYLEYQFWDCLQAFCSSIMNNLATQAIFKGVGVGDSSATILAATITWILKDGTSIIGSLIFATIQCTRMDSDCKRWRLFADLMNDFAIFIDLMSPIFFGYQFTIVQCISGILRSLVGIAGGATRAALTQHQAKCNNMADVSAKDQSQERIVNLFALLFSLLIIPFVSDQLMLTWSIFIMFTIGHLYSNYRAVRSIRFNVFNCKRLAIFLDNFYNHPNSTQTNNLSIQSVNSEENVWFFRRCKHDTTFENVYFVHDKIQNHHKKIVDPINEKFIVYHNDNTHMINVLTNEPSVMIEALCLVFLLKNRQSISESEEMHRKCMPKIKNEFAKNQWDISHVLMAEIIMEDDFDHDKFD